jgi:hypothetical protein
MADHRDTDRIQREIHETQARMSRTIDQIQDRLQPRRLMDQVTHMFTSSSNSTGNQSGRGRNASSNRHSTQAGGVADLARDNVLPIALIGLGLGWLVWSATSHPQADRRLHDAGAWARRRVGLGGGRRNVEHHRSGAGYGSSHANLPDRYRNDLGMAYGSEEYAAPSEYHYREAGGEEAGYAERARGAMDSVRERVSDYAESAAETVSDYAGRARGMMRGDGGADRNYAYAAQGSASGGIWDTVERHPLVSGAVGFALGAAVGAAIPSSRYEDEWLGEYRDSLMERGREYGSGAIGRATEVARQAAEAGYEAAKETVREEAQNQGLVAGQGDQEPSRAGQEADRIGRDR